MLNIRKSGAVLFAKDPGRVARFYEAVAGLKVMHSGADIIVLESAGSQLLVHPIPAKIARSIDITVPAKVRTNAAVKLVFAIKSIAAARATALRFGGALEPSEQMFETRGVRACDGQDPEGNVIQFREDVRAPESAPPKASRRGRGGVDYATVRELALALPNVADSLTLRGIAFKARGRLLACKAVHRSAEAESLVVRVGAAERDRLLNTEPQTYYLTPHYAKSEAVLVRLTRVDREGLQALFERAWTFVTAPAPRR